MGHRNNIEIEQLIEKFFDGRTSNEEEKFLYNFFSGEEVPASLEKYKTIFNYFESNLEDELNAILFSEQKQVVADKKMEIGKENTLLSKKWIWTLSAIAASFLLFFITKLYTNNDYKSYGEGSYIQHNGIVSTDRKELEAEKRRLDEIIAEAQSYRNIENRVTYLAAETSLIEHQVEKVKQIEDEISETIYE